MFHLGYYWWLVGITNIYQNLGDLTRSGDFTWRVSACEELMGVIHRRNWAKFAERIAACFFAGCLSSWN